MVLVESAKVDGNGFVSYVKGIKKIKEKKR